MWRTETSIKSSLIRYSESSLSLRWCLMHCAALSAKRKNILNADYRLADFWQPDGKNAAMPLSAIVILRI